MNYLSRLLEFDTVEQGEKNLKEAEKLRDSMCGGLYYKILSDDCNEIEQRLFEMKCNTHIIFNCQENTQQ